MEGSLPNGNRELLAVAAPDPNEQIRLIVKVRRRPGAPTLPGIDDYTRDSLLVPRVSRRTFATHYGAAPEDLDAVGSFAEANELSVEESSTARRVVVLRGSIEAASRAFCVPLAIYERNGERYRGQAGHVYVPSHLFGVIEGVFGFDNRRMASRSSGDGGSYGWPEATPYNTARLYDFPLPIDVRHQTIALLEFGGGYKVDKTGAAPDVVKYFSDQGLPMPGLASYVLPGGSNDPGGRGDTEVLLDIEVAGAVAPGVNLLVYFAPFTETGWIEAVDLAIHGLGLPEGWLLPSVISISWGWPELEPFGQIAWTADVINTIGQSFQEAAAFGVSVLAASGDSGTNQAPDRRATVVYPSSDPWVTSVGGTEIVDVDDTSFVEGLWDDLTAGTGGGGVSDIFNALPSWQSNANVPVSLNDGHVGRGVPDIAGYAAGYPIRVDGKEETGVPGTSEAAPLYAGLIAVINAITGFSIGYLNPILYTYGMTEVFRDIDTAQNNGRGGPGYSCGAGWDACTGWGSVNGHQLLNIIQTGYISAILAATEF